MMCGGVKILQGDCRDQLRRVPANSVHCVVTSPPYWGLRDYGTARWEGGDSECDHIKSVFPCHSQISRAPDPLQFSKECKKCGAKRVDQQIGMEDTPEEYVQTMVEVFRELRRVLRDDGTVWLNLGDTYCAKNLVGVPWRVALALQEDGWYLRNEIIWSKPNFLPESVRDRCSKSHEHVFLLTKNTKYYFDMVAIREPTTGTAHSRGRGTHPKSQGSGIRSNKSFSAAVKDIVDMRNKRTVWTVKTKPYSEAHFATYPPELITPCILAGTSEGGCCRGCGAPYKRVLKERERNPKRKGGKGRMYTGRLETSHWEAACSCQAKVVPCTVLDPFGGSGTTAEVAIKKGRRAILIELNEEYVDILKRRIDEAHRNKGFGL